MTIRNKDDVLTFTSLARSMYFSKESIDDFLAKATAAEVKCVSNLISFEQSIREEHKRTKLFKRAAFPQVKSFANYDFSQVVFPDGYTSSDLISLDFIENAQDFVFFGQTGRGKTHLSVAIGIAAIDKGMQVRFFTTASLVLLLKRASRQEQLEQLLKDLGKADLIILDEFGYVPIDIDGARLLFQVISDCYEKRSLILTTNIEFSKWGTVLGDDKLASAAIDRIIHHGRLLEFGGPSKRMETSLMLGKELSL